MTGGIGDISGTNYCYDVPPDGDVTYIPGDITKEEVGLSLSTGLTIARGSLCLIRVLLSIMLPMLVLFSHSMMEGKSTHHVTSKYRPDRSTSYLKCYHSF